MRIQLVRGYGCLSRGIAWWGQGYNGWSHGDAVMSTGELAGARSDRIKYSGDDPRYADFKGKRLPAGCQVRPPSYERWQRRTLFEKKVNVATDALWDGFFRARTGIAYDKPNIVNFFLGRAPVDDGMWFCTAWLLQGLETLDEVASICLPPRQCAPDMLGAIISATGWLIIEDEVK